MEEGHRCLTPYIELINVSMWPMPILKSETNLRRKAVIDQNFLLVIKAKTRSQSRE